MALTAEEQRLFDFAKAALPPWIRDDDEFLLGCAKMFGSVQATIDYWIGQTLITTALGPTATSPDWLNQHARDRDTNRQPGETSEALRDRLRNVPDALIPSALIAAANAILVADGIAGTAAIVELPRSGAYLGSYLAMSGVGGVFVQAGTSSKFTPDALPWPTPPWQSATITPVRGHRLTISGAFDAGNDGARIITGLEGNAAIVTNAGGVDADDATVTWTVERLDVEGNVRDGFARAYLGRGYRMSKPRPLGIVLILPYGSTSGTEASVREMLRQKKAGGFYVRVERRLNP